MRNKGILFDMFDTLMMIEQNHQFYIPSLKNTYKILKNNGINASFSDFFDAYTKARTELYEKADANNEEPHFNERIVKALELLGYNYSKDNPIVKNATFAFCKEFMKYVRIDKNAKKVLRKLNEKYQLGIVSNFAIPECVEKLLQDNGITDLFNVVVVSGAINKRKPSPEIFETAIEALNLNVEDVMFVGDTLEADIKGANEVGMKTIFIERRIQKDDILPDIKIKNLEELLLIAK